MIYIDASHRNGNPLRTQTLETKANEATTSTAIPAITVLVTSGLESHYIATGPNPVATTSSFVIPQGCVLQFIINHGDKISVLSHASQGHVSIAY